MRFVLIVACLILSTITAKANNVDHSKKIIEWLRSKEHGYFSDKLEIRQVDTKDPNSHLGVFATKKIVAKELLLEVPDECIISIDNKYHEEGTCFLAQAMKAEIELGDESKYAPYVKFLKDQSDAQIPSTWSTEGKELLQDIIMDEGDGDSVLPPSYAVNFWGLECGSDPRLRHSLALAIQRGWDTVIVPVYDMFNHHNGKKNTENTSVKGDNGVIVTALKEIQPGEEIFVSYDVCLDCFDTAEMMGTPEILRDYGFIEDFPQRWHLGEGYLNEKISFNLNQKMVNGMPTLQVEWLRDKPDETGIKFLEEQKKRLADGAEEYFEEIRDTVPSKEFDIIMQYYKALSAAVASAIKTATGDVGTCGLKYCADEELESIEEDIDLYYRYIYQCDETLNSGMDHYEASDHFRSHYQTIDYYKDPANNDTCFHLDNIYQMCGCYWPHYHEMVVHKTAKYLNDDIKRVLWVGGGDSGLLNEIIKYPTLELVVGLELDQKVTRGAFKHFGSEPNYDNEKVQWWYGDASKSLLMLPKDYFGTFDMILVDLSDTIFSLSVSEELDVVAALSLLLRPGGIFEMNELFFEKVSAAFKYAIHYTYQDVPKVCDQSLIMASNDVNFLDRELTERNIENLLVETSSHKTKHRFDMVHDFRKNENSTFMKLCKKADEVEDDPTKQDTSPGILMVVEVENVSAQLQSIEEVKNAVVEALEKEGFNLLSSAVFEGDVGGAVIILHEGYVVVRTWPDHKYCAFDIHLWSAFNNHESAKKAVIKSVGGDFGSTSSYRIVAGGMFGVSSWKDDVKSRGPKVTQVCNPSATSSDEAGSESSVFNVVLEKSLGLVQQDNVVIAVVCGHETEPCDAIDLIKRNMQPENVFNKFDNDNKNVHEVVALYTCADIKSEELYFDDFMDRMDACEYAILEKLKTTLSSEKKLGGIVVDKKASREMGDIVQKTFRGWGPGRRQLARELGLIDKDTFENKSEAHRLLDPAGILVMAAIEDRTDSWQRDFVNSFRQDVITMDPVFSAQVIAGESKMEIGITLSGDTHFIQHLTEMISDIKEKKGLALEIQNIVGGFWRSWSKLHMEDSEASQYFLPGDLHHPSLERWRAQRPLGHQTVFQLDQTPAFEVGERVLGNFEGHGEWYAAEVMSVNDYNTYDLKYYDGGDEEANVKSPTMRKLNSDATDLPKISSTAIDKALKQTLQSMESEDTSSATVHVSDNVGDGYLVVALWRGGIAIVLWDGRVHIDINLCTYKESAETAEEFAKHFTKSLPGLMIILRDEQPRGTGRVVNFLKDIQGWDTNQPFYPHWTIDA